MRTDRRDKTNWRADGASIRYYSRMSDTALARRMAANRGRFTPTERRIAVKVSEEPTLIAFGTVVEVAESVGASGPTVVRFAVKLGFAGFTDLQEFVREGMTEQLTRPIERFRKGETSTIAVAARNFEASLRSVIDAASDERLERAADSIRRADSVWITSGETSRAGAHSLVAGLRMIRPRVRVLDVFLTGADLVEAGPGDVAVIFDFRRYRHSVIRAASMLVDSGVELIAVTDGPMSPLANLTKNWFGLTIPAIGPFDSSVPSVAMAELLVASVAARIDGDVEVRLEQAEQMWDGLGTYLEDD